MVSHDLVALFRLGDEPQPPGALGQVAHEQEARPHRPGLFGEGLPEVSPRQSVKALEPGVASHGVEANAA